MGRGRSVYLDYTTLALFALASPTFADSIWHVSIDESPAPPSDHEPPFSAHASRDRALIPYQVIGIVGAYIGAAILIGTFLLIVGRSRRTRALRMAAEPTEMVKPNARFVERSPVSPGEGRPWYNPRRIREKKSVSSSIRSDTSDQVSPAGESIASFDAHVLEADRRRRQVEMERLYAAVLSHDEARQPESSMTAGAGLTTDMPPEYTRRNPPPSDMVDPTTVRYAPVGGVAYMDNAARSPVRAIYPPDNEIAAGLASPTTPFGVGFPTPTRTQYPDPWAGHARGPSEGSTQTAGSGSTSLKTKLRKPIRNIKISAPIVRDDDYEDNDRTPLSPRYYVDPGIPPEPPTAGTTRSVGWDAATLQEEDEEDDVDHVRDIPQAYPQRASEQHLYPVQPQPVPEMGADRRPRPIKTGGGPGNGTLPLREINRQYAAQQQQQAQTARAAAFPLSPGHWNPLSPNRHAYATSAGPTKTTFLEARRDKLSGPRTGVPTPYSPYMPFTPLTPVTPHLVSKAERKQREKEEKRFKKPIMEEDAVADEKDLWDSGY